MQRNFEPMRKQVELWRQSEVTDVSAKMIIYQAFIESELQVPRHLARRVHDLYFDPQYDEFKPRTVWSLSNRFTSAFKELGPDSAVPGNSQARRFPRSSLQGESLRANEEPAVVWSDVAVSHKRLIV